MDDWHTTASLQGEGWKDRRKQMKLGSRKTTQHCLCTDLCNHPSQRQRGWAHRGCKQPTKPFCCAPREDRTQHRGNMHRTPCPTDICVQYISKGALQWSQGGGFTSYMCVCTWCVTSFFPVAVSHTHTQPS